MMSSWEIETCRAPSNYNKKLKFVCQVGQNLLHYSISVKVCIQSALDAKSDTKEYIPNESERLQERSEQSLQ
jgi:hypothetical protein